MSCCSQSPAKTGRSINVFTVEINPLTSGLDSGDCISDKFIIDCASFFPGGTGIIEQVDIIGMIGLSGAKTKMFSRLFLAKEDYSAPAQGSPFSITPGANGLSDFIACDGLSGKWEDIDTTKDIQLNKSLGINFSTGGGRYLYGQLLADDAVTFSSGTTLVLRIYIGKD